MNVNAAYGWLPTVRALRKRFYPVGARNFSSYARRSARVFGSKKIVRQVLRLERMIDKELRDLDA